MNGELSNGDERAGPRGESSFAMGAKRPSRRLNGFSAVVQRLETKPGPLAAQPRTVAAIRTALEQAGVEFIAENGGGAGVRLRRASGDAA